MSRSTRLAEAYIGALGLSRIDIVAQSESGLCAIEAGATVAPDHAVATLWCADSRAAAVVAKATRAAMAVFSIADEGWFVVAPEEAAAAVVHAADTLKELVRTDTSVQARIADRIARLNIEFKAMQEKGDLKSLNREYRDYRSDMAVMGKRGIAYGKYVVNYKARMLQTAAINERRNFMLTVSL